MLDVSKIKSLSQTNESPSPAEGTDDLSADGRKEQEKWTDLEGNGGRTF